jgi:uncharacterized membrane protein YfcA
MPGAFFSPPRSGQARWDLPNRVARLHFFFVGLFAQQVDGALGMAFGVTATTVMLSFGIAFAQSTVERDAGVSYHLSESGTRLFGR